MKAISADAAAANAATEAEAWADLQRPLGMPGSGLLRYAAAMHLYGAGLIDAATLERYRICCRSDGEDPARADGAAARGAAAVRSGREGAPRIRRPG